MAGFSFSTRGSGGGASLSISSATVPAATAGVVAQLAAPIGGSVTFSKVSGATSVSIASGGAVSLSPGLAAAATAVFVVRAANATGDAIERSFTLTGASIPATTGKFFGSASLTWGSTSRIFGATA